MSQKMLERDAACGSADGRGSCLASPPMPCRRSLGATMPGSPICSSRQTFPFRVSRHALVEPASRPPSSWAPRAGCYFEGSANHRATIPICAGKPPAVSQVPPVVSMEVPSSGQLRPQSIRGRTDLRSLRAELLSPVRSPAGSVAAPSRPSRSPDASPSRSPPAAPTVSLSSSRGSVSTVTPELTAMSPSMPHRASPDMTTRGAPASLPWLSTPVHSQSAILRRNLTAVAPDGVSDLIAPAGQLRHSRSALMLPATPASSGRAISVSGGVAAAAWALPQTLHTTDNATPSQARVLPKTSSFKILAPRSPQSEIWKTSPTTTTRRFRSVSPTAGADGQLRLTVSPSNAGREALIVGVQRWTPQYVVKKSQSGTGSLQESKMVRDLESGVTTRQSSSRIQNLQDDFDVVDLNSQADSPRTAEQKTRDLSPASQILQQDAPEVALLQQQHEEPSLEMRRLHVERAAAECPESVHLITYRSEPECSTSDDRRPSQLPEEDPKLLVRQQLESIEQALEERMQQREESQQATINEKLAHQEHMIQQLQKALCEGGPPSIFSTSPDDVAQDWMERWKHAHQAAPQVGMALSAEQLQAELAARSRLEALELRAEVERVRAQSAEEIAKLRCEVERLQTQAVDNQISQPLQFMTHLQDVNFVMPDNAAIFIDQSGRRVAPIGDVLHGLRDVTQQVDGLVQELGRRTIDAGDNIDDEQVYKLQTELIEREANMMAATEEIARFRQTLDTVRLAGSAKFAHDSFAVMDRMRRLRAKLAPMS